MINNYKLIHRSGEVRQFVNFQDVIKFLEVPGKKARNALKNGETINNWKIKRITIKE